MTVSTSPSQRSQTNTHRVTLRVAVATRGDGLVNQHFGHASSFQVYDVTESEALWVEERAVTPYCHGPDNGPGNLDLILQTLQDCTAIFVSRIGHGPDDRLRKAGIEPICVYDAIETALFDFFDSHQS
ncbi:NifB/NifX family molybdenum-iron cluster-binding protein [Baaleninema sp.]|uniref:NifB/NifX family molybdenum-iron cluster-binding protein n=1 Tax=Baaleninema sp. TaxID=3101197 RepID=UPI003D038209